MSDTHAHTVAYVRDTMLPEQAPPATSVGIVGWARKNLFSSWFNSALTIIALVFVYMILAVIVPWSISPTWQASSLSECREILSALGREGHLGGACWGVIRERWIQLLFGFYPPELYWRPILAFVLLFVALMPVLFAEYAPKKLIWFTAIYPFLMPWLLWGGSIWTPVLVVAGFAIGWFVFKAVSAATGTLLGLFSNKYHWPGCSFPFGQYANGY